MFGAAACDAQAGAAQSAATSAAEAAVRHWAALRRSSKRFPAPRMAIATWRTAILNTLLCGHSLLILFRGPSKPGCLSDCDHHGQLPRGFRGLSSAAHRHMQHLEATILAIELTA